MDGQLIVKMNVIQTANFITKLLKHTQELCLNFEKIFNDLSRELGDNNLLSRSSEKSNSDFFEAKDGWYWKDYFINSGNLIRGFRMLIAVGKPEEYPRYKLICEKLCVSESIPMILICSAMKPVSNVKKSVENLSVMIDSCSGFDTQDEIDSGYDWMNFDAIKNNICFEEDIYLENKSWKGKEVELDYLPWDNHFSEAKIKIFDIFTITDRAKLVVLANEIKAMSI